jgi:hypothetical protein
VEQATPAPAHVSGQNSRAPHAFTVLLVKVAQHPDSHWASAVQTAEQIACCVGSFTSIKQTPEQQAFGADVQTVPSERQAGSPPVPVAPPVAVMPPVPGLPPVARLPPVAELPPSPIEPPEPSPPDPEVGTVLTLPHEQTTNAAKSTVADRMPGIVP